MSNAAVRVRYAPSPTGFMHIGGLRTALFNFLFAKRHQGVFVLRIEDTDQNRYVEGSVRDFVDILRWCGIEIDEGPETGELSAPITNRNDWTSMFSRCRNS